MMKIHKAKLILVVIIALTISCQLSYQDLQCDQQDVECNKKQKQIIKIFNFCQQKCESNLQDSCLQDCMSKFESFNNQKQDERNLSEDIGKNEKFKENMEKIKNSSPKIMKTYGRFIHQMNGYCNFNEKIGHNNDLNCQSVKIKQHPSMYYKCVDECYQFQKNSYFYLNSSSYGYDVYYCRDKCLRYIENYINDTYSIQDDEVAFTESIIHFTMMISYQNSEFSSQFLYTDENQMERFNFQSGKGIVALSFPYFKNDTNEQIVMQYFATFHSDKYYKIGRKTRTINYEWHFVFKPNHINWKYFREGEQIVNHIQHIKILTNKAYISTQVFLPETYVLNLASHTYTSDETSFVTNNHKGIWIFKPSQGFGGEGIQLIDDISHFSNEFKKLKELLQQEFDEKEKESDLMGEKQKVPVDNWVIQKYIEKPQLIQNKKFDIRCYVIIPCVKPFIAIYYDGFARQTIFDYYDENKKGNQELNLENLNDEYLDDGEMDLQNDYAHISNVKKQREHPEYENRKEDTIWTKDRLKNYFISQNIDEQTIEKSYEKMKKIITYSITAFKSVYQQNLKLGQYQFLAFDFMMNRNDLNPILIEINSSPSWATVLQSYRVLKEKFFVTSMNLVNKIHQNMHDREKLKYMVYNYDKFGLDPNEWTLLINDENEFSYIENEKY